MHQHIVVITFLEWLNLNNKGLLRIAPERLVWCQIESAATAFQLSMQFAPDLEPADDAFLIANVETPPLNNMSGTLLLPLDGTKFEVLSERSSRLLSPAAKRMNAKLELATDIIQDEWVSWKIRYGSESTDQQARRIWSWAWGNSWPSDPQSSEEKLLRKTQRVLVENARLLAKQSVLREKIAGTSAEAWIHMALAAEQEKLLAPEKDANWRLASKPYVNSCAQSGKWNAAFFQESDTAFSSAFAALPLDNIQMVEFVAVAIGEHHALRLNAGQEPDLEELCSDIQILSDIAAKFGPDGVTTVLSTALLAFGGLLPGTAVGALIVKTDLPAGWVGSPLNVNEKAELSDNNKPSVSPRKSATTMHNLVVDREAEKDPSEPSGSDVETADVDSEKELQVDSDASKASGVRNSSSASIAPSEKRAAVGGHAGSKKKNPTKPQSKRKKSNQEAPTGKVEKEKDLFGDS